jgi:hypothetical protein
MSCLCVQWILCTNSSEDSENNLLRQRNLFVNIAAQIGCIVFFLTDFLLLYPLLYRVLYTKRQESRDVF